MWRRSAPIRADDIDHDVVVDLELIDSDDGLGHIAADHDSPADNDRCANDHGAAGHHHVSGDQRLEPVDPGGLWRGGL